LTGRHGSRDLQGRHHLPFLRSQDKLSRRELLKGAWTAHDAMPVIDKEKCTGCGLCAMDCPTAALTVSRSGEEDAYRLLFWRDRCDSCRICEKSCPENCLKLERIPEGDRKGRGVAVIFENEISRCSGCGAPLFPQAMVNHVRYKMLAAGQSALPFDLCLPCRIKRQFGREKGAGKKG
jgi:Pyruvate/2-oxoacid:ferredoxin oxidoreductase delta subunit